MTTIAPADLAALRQHLERERAELSTSITQAADENVNAARQYDAEFSGYSNEPADTATEIYEQERNLAIEGDLERQLADVERALSKLDGDGGTYGLCENCGKEIPLERLQARPQARYDIDCERLMEARQR